MLKFNQIFIFLFFIAVLGGTSFNFLQVGLEFLLILLLILQARKYELTKTDVALLIIFIWTTFISVLSLDPLTFILHFKIYLLFILVFFACKNLPYERRLDRFINFAILINCFMIWYQTFFGFPSVIPKELFAPFYQSQIELRPIGIFLLPHPSSFFLAIFAIYLFQKKGFWLKNFILITCFFTMSFTAVLACLAQIIANVFNKKLNIIFYLFVLSLFAIYYFFKDSIMELLMLSSYTRYYSVGPILDQIINPYYWEYVLNIIPQNLDDVMSYSEEMYGLIGAEVGFVRMAIQVGIIFLFVSYLSLIRQLPNYSIFIFVTMLHYSYVYIMPFMLALMFYFEKKLKTNEY